MDIIQEKEGKRVIDREIMIFHNMDEWAKDTHVPSNIFDRAKKSIFRKEVSSRKYISFLSRYPNSGGELRYNTFPRYHSIYKYCTKKEID